MLMHSHLSLYFHISKRIVFPIFRNYLSFTVVLISNSLFYRLYRLNLRLFIFLPQSNPFFLFRFMILAALTILSVINWLYLLLEDCSKEHFILNHLEMSETPFNKKDPGLWSFMLHLHLQVFVLSCLDGCTP